MSRAIYLKLALRSMRRNYRVTVPFLCGSALMVCLIYSCCSLAGNPGLASSYGGMTVQSTLLVGCHIMEVFTLVFYFYLSSVWNRHREQENGLYSVLGMERKHLIRIIAYQMIASCILSLAGGIALGILLDKILSMIILQLFSLDPVLGFYISPSGITESLIWTLGSYLLIFLYSIVSLLRTNPIDQMKKTRTSEKPVKNRWIFALLGLICLGIGYYLAVTIQNPIDALALFFIAVLFVIAGTYLLFMFGLTTILGLMQKSKNYYYKTSHFISVSSMRYRLRQNAAALANITILSTMVLVTLSTTVSLMASVDKGMGSLYSRDVKIFFPDASGLPDTVALSEAVEESAREAGLDPQRTIGYKIEFVNLQDQNQNQFESKLIDIDDLNRISNQNISLAPDQAIVFGSSFPEGSVITDTDSPERTWTVVQSDAKKPEEITPPFNGTSASQWIAAHISSEDEHGADVIQFDSSSLSDSSRMQNEMDAPSRFFHALQEKGINTEGALFSIREADYQELINLYSGLMFIGLFLSVLFLMAVILIMYYKQISEGTEDKKRFEILQNVGLEPKQIRKVINDQVLILFFMPLATALMHILFAYPMISKILSLFLESDTQLFLITTLSCFAVFVLIYIVIYRLTARTYYKITCR